MRFVLLGLPPTTNNLYAIVGNHQVLGEPGRVYHGAVRRVAAKVWSGPILEGPFAVLITYYLGRYDRDVDGSHKPILDALSGTVWKDDRQVVLLAARKRRLPPGVLPYLSVVVRPLKHRPIFRIPSSPRRAVFFKTTVLPPSTNNSYSIFRGFRRKTARARRVIEHYRAEFVALTGGKPPLSGALRARVRYGFTADRRDVDGSHKLLFDAGKEILWNDDRQIISFSVAKARITQNHEPLIVFSFWELPATIEP